MIKKTQIAACAIATMTLTGAATTASAQTPTLAKTHVSATSAMPHHALNHVAQTSTSVNTNAKSPAASSKTKPTWLTIILMVLKWILGLFGG